MDEELSLDNILGTDEIEDLFLDDDTNQEDNPDKNEQENKEETTEILDTDSLFVEESEGVGSEDENNNEEKENTSSTGEGSSPNFYSSITKALREEGVFPDLDETTADNVKNPEDFVNLIEDQIKSRLDETQKRIKEALDAGIESSEIKKYENTISYLDSIKEEILASEDNKGENLRKQLIYQDFINRGYSEKRAQREVEKSFNAGTDIEDAKEALESNREYFKNEYDSIIKQSQEEIKREEAERKQQAEELKNSILSTKEVFNGITLDSKTRQAVYDNIAKPIYKDPETGEYYTALQKYEMNNRTEFLKNIGLLFTLTDSFKNLDRIVKNKVNTKVNKHLKELEHTINNSRRDSDGNLSFVSGVSSDPEAFINKGWDLDV